MFKNYEEDFEKFKDIYTIPIGDPVGKRYFEDGVWKRKYEKGLVLANPGQRTETVVFDRGYINVDKDLVRKVILTPRLGVILLNK